MIFFHALLAKISPVHLCRTIDRSAKPRELFFSKQKTSSTKRKTSSLLITTSITSHKYYFIANIQSPYTAVGARASWAETFGTGAKSETRASVASAAVDVIMVRQWSCARCFTGEYLGSWYSCCCSSSFFFFYRWVRRSNSRCDKSLQLRNSKPVGIYVKLLKCSIQVSVFLDSAAFFCCSIAPWVATIAAFLSNTIS